MWKEFKEFAIKGNALELAVGVILATTFQPIVNSLVNDVIMPPIGVLVGQVDFKDKFVPLQSEYHETLAENRKNSVPVVAYGQFVNTVVNFFVVAFCVFLIVKSLNKVRRAEESAPAEPAAPSTQEKLLMEIRDAVREQGTGNRGQGTGGRG